MEKEQEKKTPLSSKKKKFERWTKMGISPIYLDMTFKDYFDCLEVKKLLAVNLYYKNIKKVLIGGQNIVLFGPGVGKTGIACELVKRVDEIFKGGGIILEAEKALAKDVEEIGVKNVPFLVIDAMQSVVKYSSFDVRKFNSLIDFRRKMGLPTAITSSVHDLDSLPVNEQLRVNCRKIFFEIPQGQKKILNKKLSFDNKK